MARSMMPDSAGSQFFIMHKTSPHLDGSYAAFGKVTGDSMAVVNKIAETPTDYNDRPLEEQKIKSMTVDCFGVDYPEPGKNVIFFSKDEQFVRLQIVHFSFKEFSFT